MIENIMNNLTAALTVVIVFLMFKGQRTAYKQLTVLKDIRGVLKK